MSLIKILILFREEVKRSISCIEDSTGFINDDQTTPNWATKKRLTRLLETYLLELKPHGFRVIKWHISCRNKEHQRIIYDELSEYDIDINIQDYTDITDRCYFIPIETTYAVCRCDEKDYSPYDVMLNILGENGDLLPTFKKLAVVYHEFMEAIWK